MKKIVSNVLVVSIQLVIGSLFLFMLFSGHPEDNRVAVVENNNLNKMADAVSELFESDQSTVVTLDKMKEEELASAEEKAKEEAERLAREEEERKQAEEAARKAQEAERIAQEEARKAQEAAAQAAREAEAQANSVSNDVASLQSYAHDLVIGTYGWSEADFTSLVSLWNRESGWKVTAGNRSSGAYGIPQSLPGSKMASEGSDWQTNGQTQIRWGLKYIQSTYGSPSAAWNHFCNVGWY